MGGGFLKVGCETVSPNPTQFDPVTSIRVACDYGAFPVWADVKISHGLRDDFTAWAGVYGEILGLDEPFTEGTWPNHLVTCRTGWSSVDRLQRGSSERSGQVSRSAT